MSNGGKKEKARRWVGSGLLSHPVTRAVPSALVSLTAGFGMEPGGPSPLEPPTHLLALAPLFMSNHRPTAPKRHFTTSTRPESPLPRIKEQSPRPLVPVRSTHCCASTSGLSNSSSSSGLTPFRDGESHLEVGFPLRCFQRFSPPEFATRPCRWRDNRRTSAPSTPVLSY